MNSHPQVTPYKSLHDLHLLKEWFYPKTDSIDHRSRAIEKVSSYSTRGNIPHSIDATSILTSSILLDEQISKLPCFDDTSLKLNYTMAIIKFVNGLLDPYQKSNFAMSLHRLAEILGLPSYFVELRHIGTHEFLPSLEMLRLASKNALLWLEDNYWSEVIQDEQDDDQDDKEIIQAKQKLSDLNKHFKTFRKIRKENIDKEFKFGDSSSEGKEYWKSLTFIKEYDKAQLQNYMLKHKCLIVNGPLTNRKINGIRRLYKPVLEELGFHFTFNMFKQLLIMVNTEQFIEFDGELELLILSSKEDLIMPSSKDELLQIQNWLEYLICDSLRFGKNSEVDKFINKGSINSLVNLLGETPSEVNLGLLKLLLKRNEQLIKLTKSLDNIKSRISMMEEFVVPAGEISTLKRNLEEDQDNYDILPKNKKSKPSGKQFYLFDTYDNWMPTPFGIC